MIALSNVTKTIVILLQTNNYNNNKNNNNDNKNNSNKGLIPTLAVANARLPSLSGSNGPLYCVEGPKLKSNSHIVQIQVPGLAY